MTINELLADVLRDVAEWLARIVLAFTRTFNLVEEGKLGSLVLSDLGIVAVVIAVSVTTVFAMLCDMGEKVENWLDKVKNWRKDHRHDDD